MSDEKRLTVRVPMRMYDALMARARRDGVSVNALLVQLIGVVTGLADPKQRRPVKEGDNRRASTSSHGAGDGRAGA